MTAGNVEVGDGGGNGSTSETRGEVVKSPMKMKWKAGVGEATMRRFGEGEDIGPFIEGGGGGEGEGKCLSPEE